MVESTGNLVSIDFESRESKPLEESIFFQGSFFWIENEAGVWVKKTEPQLRRWLKGQGVPHGLTAAQKEAGESLSELDKLLLKVETDNVVEWCGVLAGRKAGLYTMSGQRVLVTHSPKLIEPVEPGEKEATLDLSQFAHARPHDDIMGGCRGWPVLGHFWRNLFTCKRTAEQFGGAVPMDFTPEDFDQRMHFFAWLQRGVRAVYESDRLKGHAILLAGEPECGKTCTVWILQQLFGGRIARPLRWVSGASNFNSNMFTAPLLVIDDEANKTTIKDRKVLSAQVKQITAVMAGTMEGKRKDEIELEPIWRLVFATNLEESNLLVFPPLDDDIRDKVILFKAYSAPFPWHRQSTEAEVQDLIGPELPYFLHWLLYEFEVPDSYKARWGVEPWHHPEIREKIEFLSPEARQWSFIERTVLRSANYYNDKPLEYGVWQGPIGDLDEALRDPENGLSFKEKEKLPVANTMGKYLKSLSEMPSYKGMITQKRTGKSRYWVLMTRDKADELAAKETAQDEMEMEEEIEL